jgi:hypothetical protein
MASASVQVDHQIYASRAWDSYGDPTTALGFIDPNFEFVSPADAVVPGTRHGHAGFLVAMESAVDALEHFSHEPLRFVDAGDKLIVDLMLQRAGA